MSIHTLYMNETVDGNITDREKPNSKLFSCETFEALSFLFCLLKYLAVLADTDSICQI